jgi:hypothetical protein
MFKLTKKTKCEIMYFHEAKNKINVSNLLMF